MTPTWPLAKTSRILTLVGNDLTIDIRARKTASSLARAGFSVISIGIDKTGLVKNPEFLDGALLHRVTPPTFADIPTLFTSTTRFLLSSLRRAPLSSSIFAPQFNFHKNSSYKQTLFLYRCSLSSNHKNLSSPSNPPKSAAENH